MSMESSGSSRAGAESPLALDLDDPHANHLRPSGRPEGGRAPGFVRLAGDAHDRALLRCVAAPGPGRGQAPRQPGVSCDPLLARAAVREKLERFRARGAQSYPSRTKDRDDVDFSTGSVGLGVAITLFASLVQDYVRLKAAPAR